MRRTALTIAALAIGAALTIAGAAGAREATKIRVTAKLTTGQETPAPSGGVGAARGTFTATLTKTSGGAVTVAWKLTFNGLTGAANAAHIHTGAPGQSGPVAVPLCGPCQSGMTGTASTNDDVIRAIQAGNAYVNVHTGQNPAGEIRGRLSMITTIRTALVPRQERPRPTGRLGRAHGLFTGTVIKTGSKAVLKWRLTFRGLTGRALAAHVHIGARGKSGAVAIPLCGPCRSGAHGTKKLNAKTLKAIGAGTAYVNVHTRRNPAGEIRGQLPAAVLSMRLASTGGGGGGGDDCIYGSCPP